MSTKIIYSKYSLTTFVFVSITLATSPVVLAASEEQELALAAKHLKPISDSQWNEIASTHLSDTYEVQKGDTLWSISGSLFGNSFYWPKVWSFNNAEIGNPHIIDPGQKLAFKPGNSEALPSLQTDNGTPTQASVNKVSSAAVTQEEKRRRGTHEYDRISPEMWAPEESFSFGTDFDEGGIDRDMRVDLDTRFSFRVPSFVNDSTIPHLGEIVASRRDGAALGTGEVVFIKSNGLDLQVGTSYSVLSDPTTVQEKKSDRLGFAYAALGEIRIIGVKDELYVAEITKGTDVITRGNRVYPLLPLITDLTPKPSRAPVEALATVDPSSSIANVSQYKFVFFDRGLEDGVEPGNVFRIYDYYDPVTQKKITDSDFLISADAIVVHATAQFSTALILRARNTVTRGDFGVLLTDVNDLLPRKKKSAKSLDENEQEGDRELDELDELDRNAGEGLGKKEEAEIKELDYWDKTKDLEPKVPADAQPAPVTEPSSSDDATLDSSSVDSDNMGSTSEPAPETPPSDNQLEPLEPIGDDMTAPIDPPQEPQDSSTIPPSDDSLDSGMVP